MKYEIKEESEMDDVEEEPWNPSFVFHAPTEQNYSDSGSSTDNEEIREPVEWPQLQSRAIALFPYLTMDSIMETKDAQVMQSNARMAEIQLRLIEMDREYTNIMESIGHSRWNKASRMKQEEDKANDHRIAKREELLNFLHAEWTAFLFATSQAVQAKESQSKQAAMPKEEEDIKVSIEPKTQTELAKLQTSGEMKKPAKEAASRGGSMKATVVADEKAIRHTEAKQSFVLPIAKEEGSTNLSAKSANGKLVSTADGMLHVSGNVLLRYESCKRLAAKAQDRIRPFVEDRSMRDVRRSIDKFVTLNVQQISATLEQVHAKARALLAFLARFSGVQLEYALFVLAKKFVSQCEVQITRLHSFAFPLAEVAVTVAVGHPHFVDLLLSRLHEVSPLTIPVYWSYRTGGSESSYRKLLGYKTTDGNVGESTDEYLSRMQGYVMFYAAFMQNDKPENPHGMRHAWAYMAHLLNSLPATRTTAVALDGFLKIAGYRLAVEYGMQFLKAMNVVLRTFLTDLERQADPDCRAVYTRLQTYLSMESYRRPPDGRDMPQRDISSYDRA